VIHLPDPTTGNEAYIAGSAHITSLPNKVRQVVDLPCLAVLPHLDSTIRINSFQVALKPAYASS